MAELENEALESRVEEALPNENKPEKPVKKRNKLLSFLWNFFFYVVVVGGIVFGLPRFLVWYLDTNSPMAAITSGSMWPVLKTGDLVFIHGVKELADVKVGDIIVFTNETNSTLTIHRIISIKDGIIITKGDANFTEDTPISFDKVVGKTLNWSGDKPVRVPYLGSITVYASKFRKQ